MIVIYTNYDKVTAVLRRCAEELIVLIGSRISLDLGPPTGSFSTNIRAKLAGTKETVFFFGHGELGALIGQDKHPAINGSCAHLLNDRIVYAVCCSGLAILSQAVQAHNATVIGYRGKLLVPKSGRRYQQLVKDCVLTGAQDLIKGLTAGDARDGVERAFRSTARHLMAKGNMNDAVMSVRLFDRNASEIDVAGNHSRTI